MESSFWKIIMEYSRFLVIVLFSIYVVFVFMLTTNSSETFIYKPIFLVILIIIPMILIGVLYLNTDDFVINHNVFIILCIMGIIGAMTITVNLYITTFTPSKTSSSSSGIPYVSWFILFSIIIIGLTLYYNVFIDSVKKRKGWSGFFINLMFYIPCLITDYFTYLSNEVKNTPSIVFILFIIEVCLLLLYIYLPSIVNATFIPSGISLLSNPVFLTPSNIITGSSTFLTESPVTIELEDSAKKTYNSHFSLSMWIFINNTILGTNKQESVIFKYAKISDDFYGKPSITYLGNDNWRFMLTNNTGYSEFDNVDLKTVPLPEYIVKMASQKWHHIVFTYSENKVDLCINGSLARTMDLSDRLPIKYGDDVIMIGSETPFNIPGAICNIKYYKNPLTIAQVSRIYNTLFMFNPPVNNLQ